MSQSEIAVAVRGLSKSYTIAHDREKHSTLAESMLHRLKRPFERAEKETFWALKDVSFDINKGDVVGIIGRNGAGKSTLLKILSRITEPTNGEARLYGRVGSLLEVGTGFHPELTGRENIYLNGQILGMRKKEIDNHFDAIVDFSGVENFLDTPVKRFSSGMYVRLAFSVAAHLNPEILVIDEVLAVGDTEFQKKCLGKIKDVASGGRTVLFVSHNMSAVSELCSFAALLQNGEIAQVGDLPSVIGTYLRQGSQNEFKADSGALRYISLRQTKEGLQISAECELPCESTLLNLGVVVSDMFGTPIFGVSPRISGIDRCRNPMKRGCVFGTVRQPVLLDGSYRVSVWVGDGHVNFARYPDCLTFVVSGMAGRLQLPTSVVGHVWPTCDWRFETDEART